MKRVLIILSLSVLVSSCGNGTAHKITHYASGEPPRVYDSVLFLYTGNYVEFKDLRTGQQVTIYGQVRIE